MVFVAMLAPAAGAAQSNPHSETRSAQSQAHSSISVEAELEEYLAREWGLKTEEWARYRELMRGPLGIYSPNLDPLTTLGIEARTDEERRYYAELQVQAEGRRVQKTLAYQRAYDEAWKRLHPTLHPVRQLTEDVSVKAKAAIDAGKLGHLAVFIKDDCQPCEQRVKQLQAQGRAFDLYMVGSRNDDSRIRRWAARAGVDPAKVRARTITLNHDAGRWLSIGEQGELPAVLMQVNGRWQRQ